MEAEYVEAGPPAIGGATVHTHTIGVSFTSETSFEGSYIHELNPNAGDSCTFHWTITGTKQ
jgi:hypothetical protein